MQSFAWKSIVAVMIFGGLVTAGAVAENVGTIQSQQVVAVAVGGEVMPLPVPTTAAGSDQTGNFTKIEILPSYINIAIKPGESEEKIMTVRNRDSRTIRVRPFVQNYPYDRLYQVEDSWISITPERVDIPAGESAKFTIRATIPKDTDRGSYSTQIVVTDEQYPSPYPQVYASYIHAMGLSIEVAATPVLGIDPAYISDQLESGKEYRYVVALTNNGPSPLSLAPRVVSNYYAVHTSSGSPEPALTEQSFVIDAPDTIPPGGNVNMTVTVNAPADGTGYYYGYIDLGIDDLSVREGEGQVQLNFMVWQQPQETFTRQFTMASADPIVITLTANGQGYQYVGTVRDTAAPEPSFDVTLAGPGGTMPVQQVKKEMKGTVSIGGDSPVYRMYGTGASRGYQEYTTQYVFTYTAQGAPGTWTLAIMPKNTQTFDYTISFRNAQEESPLQFLQPLYFTGIHGTNPE